MPGLFISLFRVLDILNITNNLRNFFLLIKSHRRRKCFFLINIFFLGVIFFRLYSSGFADTHRKDHHMDPIYNITEFNSENFHWMARAGGYIFAEEYDDTKELSFYSTFVDNLVRATYNLGRLEWDSNNYFGYSFGAIAALYQYSEDHDVKAKAKAVMDWVNLSLSFYFPLLTTRFL